MVANVPITETRHGRILAKLAAWAVEMAEDFHHAALSAETVDDKVRLGAIALKAQRCARQDLALEAKLDQDNARAVREQESHDKVHRAERERTHKEAVIRRREDLRLRLERVAWDEVPDADFHEDFQACLHDVLAEQAELSTFLDEDPDAQYERLYRDLNLGVPEDPGDDTDAPPDGAETDGADPAEADDWPHGPFVRIPGQPKPDSS